MIATFRAVTCSAAIAGCALLFLSGCSIIGLGVGAGIDATRSIRAPRRLLQTPPGTHVKLKLRDGAVLRGSFAGMNSAAEGREHAEIRIDVGDATRIVPYESVSSAKIRGVHSAKTILFWTGLGTDVSVLLLGSVGNPSDAF